MSDWQSYTELHPQHTVVGDLGIKQNVYSPQLDNERDVFVYLPPSYANGEKSYPVVYMHDGQNLFDHFSSFSDEWQVDEAMTILAENACEAIIVGLPNLGEERIREYNPYSHPQNKQIVAKGDAYIRFIIETVKPLIDSEFRTLKQAEHTGIAGSSLGGLISLYGFLHYQNIFGFCGALSPAYWFADGGLLKSIEEYSVGNGKIYLDIGTLEGVSPNNTGKDRDVECESQDNVYVCDVRSLRDTLLNKGYRLNETLIYIEDEGARHNEQAWARRFPTAIRYLLGC